MHGMQQESQCALKSTKRIDLNGQNQEGFEALCKAFAIVNEACRQICAAAEQLASTIAKQLASPIDELVIIGSCKRIAWLAAHAKKKRKRKKNQNRLKRIVFERRARQGRTS